MHVSVLDTAPPCPVIDVHTNSRGATGVRSVRRTKSPNHQFILETSGLFEVMTSEQTQVARNHTKDRLETRNASVSMIKRYRSSQKYLSR